MIGEIKDIKSVKGSHRIIDNSSDSKTFGFCERDLDPGILNFKTIELFLENAISKDYADALPNSFLKDIYYSHENKRVYKHSLLSNEERDNLRLIYSNKIYDLKKYLKNELKKYCSIVSSSDCRDTENYVDVDHMSFTIKNMLAIAREDNDHRYPTPADINYLDFPTVNSHIINNNLLDKALVDVKHILNELSDIGNLSEILTYEENSYRKFASKIILHMYGNVSQVFPRSIINHSAFKFCIDEYPYNTLSRRIYSVSNVPKNIKNKFSLVEIYHKNIYAMLNFLSDLTFDFDEKSNIFNSEVKTMVNAYGTCIALCGIAAEQKLYEDYTRGTIKITNSFK